MSNIFDLSVSLFGIVNMFDLASEGIRVSKNGLVNTGIIIKGNNPKIPEYSSEWGFLKTVGVNLGVPEERILKEDKASNTFENAEFSLKVIEEKRLTVKKAILVCKSFHARRALLTYQAIFPKDIEFYVAPVSDKRNLRKDNWFMDDKNIKLVMGEVVKIGQYFESYIKQFHEESN